ncbi:MAG: NADH-quinone oxidoreductase subunit N [Nitrososphaerales archaeon]
MVLPFLIVGILASFALILPGIGFFYKGFKNTHGWILSLIALLASLALLLTPPAYSLIQDQTISFTPSLTFDSLGIFFSIAMLMVSVFVVFSSYEFMKKEGNIAQYYSLILFSSAGMVLIAFSMDLLLLFIAWELMTIPTFVLAGFNKKAFESNEAAVKYFVLGTLSTGILLYGISLVYGLTGTLQLNEIFKILSQRALVDPLSLLASSLLIAGFGLKMAIVPFHMWIPDTYEGAPTTVSTFLAAGTKKAGFAAALRVFLIALPLKGLLNEWSLTFAFLAIITMTLGNIAALTQGNILRLLAYSSIAQAGYILIVFAIANGGTKALELGVSGALFHVLNHAIMKSAAFLVAALVIQHSGRADLDYYNGFSNRAPLTAFNFTIALLALAGVPPLSGFWSKFLLFTAAIEANMIWLALAGIVNTALSLAYYALIIKRMYIDEPQDNVKMPQPLAYTFILTLSTILIMFFGLFPDIVISYTQEAAKALIP